uniref:Uncharacterized protein n=1 Tax=viral metagenome TaxID=1070528 RepID=A0A6C0BL62_9ZZZZ
MELTDDMIRKYCHVSPRSNQCISQDLINVSLKD